MKKQPKRRCMRFDIFRDDDGLWTWRLTASSGKPLAKSMVSYRTKGPAVKATNKLIDDTMGASQYVEGVELT
jgi:uncharacterized protein YegP (UPF0339 family)